MPTLTDPARELTDLFTAIGPSGSLVGADKIAQIIGVQPWSAEFHEVIASIITRLALVRGLIGAIGMDEDIRDLTITHLDNLQMAFDGSSLTNRWDQRGGNLLGTANIAALRSLVPSIRAKIQYPRLSKDEISEVINLVDELEGWLTEHQLTEQDFIRQIIIDGLRQFKFRLSRLNWLGWGYAVQSLRDVIGAYLALQSGIDCSGGNPDATAMMMKIGGFIKRVSETTGIVRGHVDNAGLMLKIYGAYALATSSHPTIAGLITAVTK